MFYIIDIFFANVDHNKCIVIYNYEKAIISGMIKIFRVTLFKEIRTHFLFVNKIYLHLYIKIIRDVILPIIIKHQQPLLKTTDYIILYYLNLKIIGTHPIGFYTLLNTL